MSRVGLLIVLLVSGCTATPEGFWRSLQRGLCKYNRDCGLTYDYDSIDDCADDRYATIMTDDAFAADCGEYGRETAYACLRYLRQAQDSCEELERYPRACLGVCGPGSQIEFAVEQPAEGEVEVMTPLLSWDAR